MDTDKINTLINKDIKEEGVQINIAEEVINNDHIEEVINLRQIMETENHIIHNKLDKKIS